MPLMAGDGWAVEEEPLTSLISERWLLELNFHSVERMSDNLGDCSLSCGTNFSVNTLAEVQNTDPQSESPTLITNTMIPEVLSGEWRESISSITDEASDRMGVETEHKDESQMMRIPESLKALLTDLLVSGCVHQKHAKKHDMSSDSTRLLVVNVEGLERTDLRLFDVKEIDIM
jgi:hypothetical protein